MTVTSEHIRRPSNTGRTIVAEPNVPPAPPLPPHFEQARNALKSVFGFNPRPDQGRLAVNRLARRPDLSSHNASTGHRTGLKINGMAINSSGSHVLLAGYEIFKTVRVQAGNATEDLNIRSAIRRFDATTLGTNSASAGRPRDVIDIKDVAWGKGIFDNYIAAATHNGPIILYDLNRLGVEASRLSEHRRQVHRISTNPLCGYMMLSSGQDGLVRVWDIRERNKNNAPVAQSVKSRGVIPSQNECIRDVKWSPTRPTDFAFGTDGGWVKTWDLAMMRDAKVTIPAHSNAVSSVDWHPDGKHVMSASVDKTIRVWNVEGEDRRRRDPVSELKGPAAIRMARWRPTSLSAIPSDDGLRQSTQFVTIYSTNHPVVHIWDLRRPKLPFRELHPYPKSPTDVLWHSQDLLWTVGAEGTFMQSDLKFARYTIDKRNLQSIALSPSGELNNYTQKRMNVSRSPRYHSSHRVPQVSSTDRDESDMQLQARHSRGSIDDSLDDTFLSLSSSQSPVPTPGLATPSQTNVIQSKDQADQPIDDCLPLTVSIQPNRVAMPTQAAIRGVLPGHKNIPHLAYLANKYRDRPFPMTPTVDDYLRIEEPFLKNAEYAEAVSAYRLAQSWRIISEVVNREVHAGAVRSRRVRMISGFSNSTPATSRAAIKRKTLHLISLAQKERDSKPGSPNSPDMPPQQDQPPTLTVPETTSNVPTPLARPIGSHIDRIDHAIPGSLLSLDSETSFSLPPARMSHLGCPSLSETNLDYGKGTLPLATETSVSLQSTLSPHATQKPHSAPEKKTQPRQILRLDLDSKIIPPQYSSKHDSEDSFGMFPSFPSSRLESFPESFASSSSQLRLQTTDNKTDGPATPFEASTGSSSSTNEQQFGDVGQMSGVDLVSALCSAMYSTNKQTKMASSAARPIPDASAAKGSPSIKHSFSDTASARTIDPEVAPGHRKVPASSMESHDLQTLQHNNQLSFMSDPSTMSNIDTDFAHKRARRSHGLSNRLEETVAASLQRESSDSSGSKVVNRKITQQDISKEPFVVSDFQQQHYGDAIDVSPLKMRPMLDALLKYHTQENIDPQMLVHLIFLLVPVLPESNPLSSEEIDETLYSYVESLLCLDFSERQIINVVLKVLAHLINAGIQPLQIESILLAYHSQLSAVGLENNAAYLRRLAYPAYPSVYEQALKDNSLHLRCGSCKKPMQFDGGDMKCENCLKKQSPCPICWCRQSPFAETKVHREMTRADQDDDDEEVETAKKEQTQTQLQKWSLEDPTRPRLTSTPVAPPPAHPAARQLESHKPNRSAVLLTTCLTCNHGAHADCLSMWHASTTSISNPLIGACPTPGCPCLCLCRPDAPTRPVTGLGGSTAAVAAAASNLQDDALPGLGPGGMRPRASEGLLKASHVRQSLKSSLSLLSPAVSTSTSSTNAGWTGSSAGSSLPFSSSSAGGASSFAVASPLTGSSTGTNAFERTGAERFAERVGAGGMGSAPTGRERWGSTGAAGSANVSSSGPAAGERRDSMGRAGLRPPGSKAVPRRGRKSMGSFGQA